ncbi:hypothetical protein ANN_15133 [Periplaneta americana]|uniref:Reverse transcriptase zinc-binding domain-containing protein n=1 Tax=Periplaneta americana TaxID=6978 RepID=A0ABQ8SZD6_PERAM|nr:hypothetical protein ANN_15133 [Periplaneta americana]
MAGLCEGGNEPPGSVKAMKRDSTSVNDTKIPSALVRFMEMFHTSQDSKSKRAVKLNWSLLEGPLSKNNKDNLCRRCDREVETLAYVLGACPHGELLRNTRHHTYAESKPLKAKSVDHVKAMFFLHLLMHKNRTESRVHVQQRLSFREKTVAALLSGD